MSFAFNFSCYLYQPCFLSLRLISFFEDITCFNIGQILFFQKATGNDASEDAAGFSNLLLLSLATFSTAYNFILYVIFNPSFKKAIFGVLRCTNTNKLNKDVTGEHSQSPESPHTADGANSNPVENANLCKIEVIANSPEFDNVNTGDSR